MCKEEIHKIMIKFRFSFCALPAAAMCPPDAGGPEPAKRTIIRLCGGDGANRPEPANHTILRLCGGDGCGRLPGAALSLPLPHGRARWAERDSGNEQIFGALTNSVVCGIFVLG